MWIGAHSPKLKVIFISGYSSTTSRRELAEDDVAFLQKPFAIGDLAAKVGEVLDS